MMFRQNTMTDGDNFQLDVKKFDEVLQNKWVQTYAKRKNFYRFSVKANLDSNWAKSTLICELNKGQEWWVLGHSDATVKDTGLPEWGK